MADELRRNWTDTYLDRCDALLDAAQDHLQNRRPDRAVAIWQQLIREGGLDGDSARLEYATHLFDQFRDDEARTELAALMAEGRVFGGPWQFAAEMLEERGELADALLWYSISTSCLTAEELEIPNGPAWAREVRAGQRRLKWSLGIRLDETDLLAEIGEAESDDKWSDLLELLERPEVIEGQLQFWARSEFERLHRLRVLRRGEKKGVNSYYQEVERVLRAHDRRLVAVPRTLHSWMSAANDARSMTELRSVARRYDEGAQVEWPPQRNQPCWCGSGTKYKRCCGANRPMSGLPSG